MTPTPERILTMKKMIVKAFLVGEDSPGGFGINTHIGAVPVSAMLRGGDMVVFCLVDPARGRAWHPLHIATNDQHFELMLGQTLGKPIGTVMAAAQAGHPIIFHVFPLEPWPKSEIMLPARGNG